MSRIDKVFVWLLALETTALVFSLVWLRITGNPTLPKRVTMTVTCLGIVTLLAIAWYGGRAK